MPGAKRTFPPASLAACDVPRGGWHMHWEEVRFTAQNTPFRHLAFFPDMAPQWSWMRERTAEGDETLNLFGYTGVGTLALAAKGARVTHVDASKKSVEAGKANAFLSDMDDRPILPCAKARTDAAHSCLTIV